MKSKLRSALTIAPLILLGFQPHALASEKGKQTLLKTFKYFKEGNYIHALSEINQVSNREDKKLRGNSFYLKGIILNRMMRYEEAIDAFELSLKFGFSIKDLYYEYGQALYANSDLEKSREAFSKSYQSGFQKSISLYYMAHITQLLEDYQKAKTYYSQLISVAEKENDKKMQQVAHFQLSECFLSMAEKRDNTVDLVEKYILPNMEKAENIAPKSALAKEVATRIKSIKRQYGLDPNLLKNGKTLPQKRFKARFRHELRYDDNVTLATDVPTASSVDEDSFIHETNFNMNYLFSHSGRFTHEPSLRLRNTYYTERDSPDVYKNDTVNITGNLNNTYEHTLFGKKASVLFDYSYVYISRDRLSEKSKIFFSRASTYSLGERFQFFDAGPTTMRVKFKNYDSYSTALDNDTTTFSIDQMKSFSDGHLLIALFQYDYIDRINDSNSTTANYMLRFDLLTPKVWTHYTLNTSLTTTFLDTKAQSDTRGLEKTITPSLELRRNYGKYLKTNLGLDYTWNISKNKESYDYEKYVIRFELSVSY